MPEQTTDVLSTECLRTGLRLANPRRLRVGRDGRPLPVPSAVGEQPHAA